MIYKNNRRDEEQNFWISYADLMAGLLFVFILLIGAIVVKYVFIQTDLQAIRTDLQKEKEALGLSESDLADKKMRLKAINDKLKSAREQNMHLAFELNRLQGLYADMEEALQQSETNSLAQAALLKRQEENIATKIEAIRLNTEELDKLKALLFDYELQEKEHQKEHTLLAKKLASAKKKSDDTLHMLELKDEELAILEKKLILKSKAHQQLVEDLNITKVKVKNLTGIKIKVVHALKEELGSAINIDPKSGAIRFSSNILFNQGGYKLKESAKKELRAVLHKYINTLLNDPKIRQYIDIITIEGHTNSDGSYLYNLELSQKRALSVMKFLYSLDFNNEALFKKYLNASGRSYAEPVLINGKEDKDASRRIEIKFRIKNELAVKELEKFLSREDGSNE